MNRQTVKEEGQPFYGNQYVDTKWMKIKRTVRQVWFWTKVSGAYALVGMIVYGVLVADKATVVYAQNVSPQVITQEAEVPVLQRIADCESGGGKLGGAHQFNKDGSIVMHVNSDGSIDEGFYQINLTVGHINQSAKLHMDLTTEEGNKAFGKWIYENEGTGPWESSAKCWRR